MQFSALFATLSMLGGAVFAAPAQTGAGTVIPANFNVPSDGRLHLADDGILRAYSANGTVVDWVRLDNSKIQTLINAASPFVPANHTEHYEKVFAGVSGHDVKNETQVTDPPANLRPAPAPTTSNPAADAQQKLKERNNPYCDGEICFNQETCTLFGCAYCIGFDGWMTYQFCLSS